MRNFLAWSLLTALALPARADIIDSGYLQVGGQAIIGGTATVQGNALGVAGSVSATSATLSGTGAQTYALTTSSGIHMVNGKLKLDSGAMIQWPDGTTSTTAASAGGGGNAVLSATQTFSGSNTFTATTTLGGTGGGLTVADGTTCTGIACRVAYASGTAPTFSFVIPLSTATYEWHYSISITSGSTANPSAVSCTVNGVATQANYFQAGTTYPNGRSLNNQESVAYFSAYWGNGAVISATDSTRGRYTFESVRAHPARLMGTGTAAFSVGAQTGIETGYYAILFKGSAPWTFTCAPYVGYGWAWESLLYEVGR